MRQNEQETKAALLAAPETMMSDKRPTFYEFFAGGGMARAGLGPGWRCVFANDFDHKKALSYQANWGAPGVIQVGDIRDIALDALPGVADVAWASFPCQDLSLAGTGAGLKGARSGTFYAFWDIVRGLAAEGRAPAIVALENVTGTLTSHGGQDFVAICQTFADHGYACGAVVINASLFVPQSRPRLFVIGLRNDLAAPAELLAPDALDPFHTRSLQTAYNRLPDAVRASWLWWNIPTPPHRNQAFSDLIEDNPASVAWHTVAETRLLLDRMSPVNLAKVEAARRAGRRMVGAIYKRTRTDANGVKAQRAEVRFDDVAGCLRTPAGGSSRQVIMVVDGERIRSRLISARETARLMGLPDEYRLPRNYNEAYHLTGDGVAAPVVRHLARHIFEPLLGRADATAEGGDHARLEADA